MDKMVEVSGTIILAYIVVFSMAYIVAVFFILSRVRKRRGARLLIRAQEATRYDQLVSVLNQAPANSPAEKLAREKVEVLVLEMAQKATTIFQLQCMLWMCLTGSPAKKLVLEKLEALSKKKDVPPSRDTLLNKYAHEEFERMMDKIP